MTHSFKKKKKEAMERSAVMLTNQMLTLKSEINALMFISMFNYLLVLSI